jgi:hypothetical protein
VLDWLACAKQHGLTISYLGGWNERDNGSHGAWFHSLRAVDNAGYANVKIISGAASAPTSGSTSPARTLPSSGRTTTVATRPAAPGADHLHQHHRVPAVRETIVGQRTGRDGRRRANRLHVPCAPAMDRAATPEYIDARGGRTCSQPKTAPSSSPPARPQRQHYLHRANHARSPRTLGPERRPPPACDHREQFGQRRGERGRHGASPAPWA